MSVALFLEPINTGEQGDGGQRHAEGGVDEVRNADDQQPAKQRHDRLLFLAVDKKPQPDRAPNQRGNQIVGVKNIVGHHQKASRKWNCALATLNLSPFKMSAPKSTERIP